MEIEIIILAVLVLLWFVSKLKGRKNVYPPHQPLDKYLKDIYRQRKEAKKSKGNYPPSDSLK